MPESTRYVSPDDQTPANLQMTLVYHLLNDGKMGDMTLKERLQSLERPDGVPWADSRKLIGEKGKRLQIEGIQAVLRDTHVINQADAREGTSKTDAVKRVSPGTTHGFGHMLQFFSDEVGMQADVDAIVVISDFSSIILRPHLKVTEKKNKPVVTLVERKRLLDQLAWGKHPSQNEEPDGYTKVFSRKLRWCGRRTP
jgi:hypothetical protein